MDLNEIRSEIDKVDSELVKLLERRYELVSQVAKAKAASGAAVLDRSREEQVLNGINQKIKNRAFAEPILDTYVGIMDVSKQFQSGYLENFVLIGMPGCGKTTIGRKFAKQNGYDFVDADEEFTRKYNISPADYIAEYGEAKFREAETSVIESFKPNTRTVFALGGGAVTVPENFELVKPLGIVVYIRRELSELATKGRPLTESKGVEKLYAERGDIYEMWADIAIDNITVDTTIEKLNQVCR